MITSSLLKMETMPDLTPRRNTRNQNVTVRFKLNEFETIAQVYSATTTIEQTLDDIAAKFQLLPKYLTIKPEKFGPKFPKTVLLKHLCKNEFGILDVQLCLSDLANHINESIHNDFEKIQLDTELYYRQYRLPDFISVSIPDKENPMNNKRIVVEIVNDPIVKPFIGGYLNKLTGIEYHNAYSQTGPSKDRIKYDGLITRDTQTKQPYVMSTDERSKPKMNMETPLSEFGETENEMAIVIQRNFRWFLWKKLLKQSSTEWRQQQTEESLPSDEVNLIEINSPRTQKDFEKLKANIRKWKESQFVIIKERIPDRAERQMEFNKLLEQEIKILNVVESKRNQINKQNQEKNMENLLIQLGAPINWTGYKNIQCEMDTLKCQKIRRLTAFYHQLKTITDKIDRIEFIHELCHVLIEEKPSNVLGELIEMLRREEKLLVANVDQETLTTLRCRQSELFRNFITSITDV